jgi:F-type H+-transporting ATPase subunit epsilon
MSSMTKKPLKLKIVTPERVVFEEEVDQVTIPTVEGEITVLPEHIALISALRSGDIVAKKNGEDIPIAVAGGFIEVRSGAHTEVVILADFAEHVAEISEDVIAKAKARAEELQKMKDNSEVVDFEHFESELARSLTRMKVGDKWKNKKYRA